jgi:pullulanase/glycogen debranching enzyme
LRVVDTSAVSRGRRFQASIIDEGTIDDFPPGQRPMINDLWYKNAVIYCLSVGTYLDSDGDGVGDFIGLLQRLDYLQGLGVTAIWLMPFQPRRIATTATTSLITTMLIPVTGPWAISWSSRTAPSSAGSGS